MIRANEPICLASGFRADQRTAMPADVVQCMENVPLSANDNDGIGANLDREILSSIPDLTRMTGENPAGAPNPIQVEPVDFLIRVELTLERLAGRAAHDE